MSPSEARQSDEPPPPPPPWEEGDKTWREDARGLLVKPSTVASSWIEERDYWIQLTISSLALFTILFNLLPSLFPLRTSLLLPSLFASLVPIWQPLPAPGDPPTTTSSVPHTREQSPSTAAVPC